MFEWDPAKARANLLKHGISFEEASTVFSDPEALDGRDVDHSSLEMRSVRIGRSGSNRIVMVAYTERSRGDAQVIRIISARRASRKERKAHRGVS